MKKSNILLAICLFFIGGLFVVSFFSPPTLDKVGDLYFSKKAIKNLNDLNKKVELDGIIIKEPDVRSNNTQITIRTEKGIILVTTRKYPEYKYGDELNIIGKPKTPTVFEDFNYQGYLAKDGIYSVMYYPKINFTGNNKGSPFYKAIYSFKNKIKTAVENIMPLPEVAILEALTLGNKRSLTDNLKEQFNITGTRHIVAISGMHIIVLSEALMFLLIILGLRRGQAFYFALIILAIFIIMVGAPASALRAGIMGGVLLFAQKIGRFNRSGRAIVFTGTIMLAINPLLLKFDVGFQLSFLAVLGIVYIKPILDRWIKRITRKDKFSSSIQIITMTLAAQIATLPILVYNFGRVSLISPLSNILIVPLLPYVMGTGLIFSLLSLAWSFLGKVLIWPAWLMFAYITKLIELFSKIPFVAKEITNIHWVWLVGYYLLLVGFLIWHNKKNRQIISPI